MSNHTKDPTNEQTLLWVLECDLIDSRDIKEEFAQSILAKLLEFAALAYAAGQAAGRDECAKVEKQRDELLKIAKDVIGMLENCSVESGVCHCGDDMARHSSAMSCGHAPVDIGSTYAAHLYEKARAAIASVKGGAV